MQRNRSLTAISFALCLSAFFLFSCSKNSGGSATQPPPQTVDSLFSWQIMDNIGAISSEDIWFVSASKGFFAGGDKNLYQTTDSGKTWALIPNTTATDYLNELFFVDAQHGFTISASQLQTTRDGGATWSSRALPTTTGLNIFFTTPATGFCGDQNSGVYKTNDTGSTWTPVYTLGTSADGFYPFFLTPNNGFVFTGTGHFAKSTDSGSTWTPTAIINFSNPNISYSTLQFLDNQNGYFAGLYGLLKTTDGGQNWNTVYNTTSHVNVVKFFDVNNGYYMADSVIYKTLDGGADWITSCKLTRDEFTGMHFISPTTGWACSVDGLILRIDQ
jgi:photosystem II stability/assembly factor-like uncharacterized protein